jgi:hypothetical protein
MSNVGEAEAVKSSTRQPITAYADKMPLEPLLRPADGNHASGWMIIIAELTLLSLILAAANYFVGVH